MRRTWGMLRYFARVLLSTNPRTEKSAGGIVYKKEHNQVLWLIVQNSSSKKWSFPKGLVGDHQDEKMETAALREVQEEGGVMAKIIHSNPVETFYTYKILNVLVKKTVYYFLMEYVSGSPSDHDWEVSESIFVDEKKVFELLNFDQDKAAFKNALLLYKSRGDS